MEITVNQLNYHVPDGCSVQGLLADVLLQSTQGLAVAINQVIIPKAQWDAHRIASGDQIMIIKATQGG